MSILAGMAVGGLFNTTVRAVTTILLGALVFSVAFTVTNPFLLVAVFAVTMVALYGMGMMFASLFMLYGREAFHTANLLQEPVFLVSGYYYPIKYVTDNIPLVFSFFIGIIPMTLGLDAMNQLAGGSDAVNIGLMPATYELAILAALTVAFVILAKYCLEYMEHVAKREARLVLRQQ
jgi:ABC-2 type transport system permease protein